MTLMPSESPQVLYRVWNSAEPTPLTSLPTLAQRCGVEAIYVKDESRRPLGSFKALGGMFAGLQALARAATASSIEVLLAERQAYGKLPMLICASDGNHGLALAAAARLAGASARIYLHATVPEARARRIRNQGADVVWVEGTYDDAVHAAARSASDGDGLLISDTASDLEDQVVADVMSGYGLMADEIAAQLSACGAPPTHLFVQAGVGGLAAALARGLRETHSLDCSIVVVEPDQAACVGDALKRGKIERLPGNLQTAAEMLSCGEASAPAIEILRRIGAKALAVDEAELHAAVDLLAAAGGPATTPSGATGLAGLMTAIGSSHAGELAVDRASRILLIVTEGRVPDEQTD